MNLSDIDSMLEGFDLDGRIDLYSICLLLKEIFIKVDDLSRKIEDEEQERYERGSIVLLE